jgi:hypothetical protein
MGHVGATLAVALLSVRGVVGVDRRVDPHKIKKGEHLPLADSRPRMETAGEEACRAEVRFLWDGYWQCGAGPPL